jgi:DNA-directed RNA polymerase subunit RPC12/RpoP
MTERRVNKCPDCGSTIFYREEIMGKNYIRCAGTRCESRWLAKRDIDPHLITLSELKKEWE